MFKLVREITRVDKYIAKQRVSRELNFDKVTRKIPLDIIQRIYADTDGCYITAHFLVFFIKDLKLHTIIKAIIDEEDLYVDYKFHSIAFHCHECSGLGYKDWVKTTKSGLNEVPPITKVKTLFMNSYSLLYNPSLAYGCNITSVRKHDEETDNLCPNCLGCGIEPDKEFGSFKYTKINLNFIYEKYIKGQHEW